MGDDGRGDETEAMLTQGSTADEYQAPVDVSDGTESQACSSSWNAWGDNEQFMSFDCGHADGLGQAGFGFPEGDSQQWWP